MVAMVSSQMLHPNRTGAAALAALPLLLSMSVRAIAPPNDLATAIRALVRVV